MDLNIIRDTLDRRQSLALFQAMRDESDPAHLMEIANVLGWLNDPRLMRPLTDILIDRSNPHALRRAASQTLRDMTNSPEPDHGDLENLWNSGDPVLQRHALGFMTWRHESMFSSILDDPRHPLYPALLSELGFAFPFPRFLEVLVTALGDQRAEVRYAAAECLAWTKPAIALEPLINALRDPDMDVRLRVIETLKNFPSNNVRAALETCAKQESLREIAEAALAFQDELCSPDTADEEPVGADIAPEGRPDWLRSAAAFKKRFGNLDTCWDRLVSDLATINWNDISRFARTEIADFLLSCPDVLVREYAAPALATWGDQRARNLLEDPYFLVTKAAGFAARHLEPSKELAEQLWTMMKSASGLHATELLDSFVMVSGDNGWQQKCASIALDQYWEEDIRNTAIQWLCDDFLETGRGIETLEAIAAQVLTDPPVCSWVLHFTILDLVKGGIAIQLPDLTHLKEVENCLLQKKIAGIVP